MEFHTIEPIYDKNSKILILGSFPSVKSREANFFYGHPQNRFWKVIASCDIEGSSDSSIKNVTPNDLRRILQTAEIKKIFTNGNTAYKLFVKYNSDLNAVKLPSTSPANAMFSLEKLIESWRVLKDFT